MNTIKDLSRPANPHGVWSEHEGAIIAVAHSAEHAFTEAARLIAEDGEDGEDLAVVELCREHEEQPHDGCQECEA